MPFLHDCDKSELVNKYNMMVGTVNSLLGVKTTSTVPAQNGEWPKICHARLRFSTKHVGNVHPQCAVCCPDCLLDRERVCFKSTRISVRSTLYILILALIYPIWFEELIISPPLHHLQLVRTYLQWFEATFSCHFSRGIVLLAWVFFF